MQFEYGGDDGCFIVSWFRQRVRAVRCCFDAGLPEASLTLLYSGIDALGLLAAPPEKNDAEKTSFLNWCDKYVMTRLKSVDGKSLTALDLYAARCGILHTSSPVSSLGREGKAREVCYQFRGQHGVNLALDTELEPTMLDVKHFVIVFEEGGTEFITDLNRDLTHLETAAERARGFFRWGTATM